MKSFLLKNKINTQVEILDYGCRIINLLIPDSNGNSIETVLRYKNLVDYDKDTNYLGCTIGRYANRILEGSIEINKQHQQLSINETLSNNHLHGGFEGFDKKIWKVVSQTDQKIEFSYFSKDGEEGYPGNLTIYIIYELDDYRTLKITYLANTDRETILNLSNHSYFNLSDNKESIDDHMIRIPSDYYTPLNENHIPYSPYESKVEGSIYDLRENTPVETIKKKICNTNYRFYPNHQFKDQALLTDIKTGRTLRIRSDYPGLQVYFGNYLEGSLKPFQGLCCEPHYAPNSPNINQYPSVLLKPDQQYKHNIEFVFDNF